jgi:predicted nuclease of predicted toxin-antitoxin system
MGRFLVDANLPYYFSIWRGEDYLHVRDLDDSWSDAQVWSFARERGLTIITKDADFSDRVLLTSPPPRVIHIRIGNVKMRLFHEVISRTWSQVTALSESCRLVRVFESHLEGID